MPRHLRQKAQNKKGKSVSRTHTLSEILEHFRVVEQCNQIQEVFYINTLWNLTSYKLCTTKCRQVKVRMGTNIKAVALCNKVHLLRYFT